MFFISPEKLLVILGVAMLVIGPDKLPKVAGQIGAFWRELQRWRARLENEAKEIFPDMPSLETIGQAVRSPLSYLDGLTVEGRSDEMTKESVAPQTEPGTAIRRPAIATARPLPSEDDHLISSAPDPSLN